MERKTRIIQPMLLLLNQQPENTTSEALSFMTDAVEHVFCLEPPPAQRRFKSHDQPRGTQEDFNDF
jgi:hypothetical protein